MYFTKYPQSLYFPQNGYLWLSGMAWFPRKAEQTSTENLQPIGWAQYSLSGGQRQSALVHTVGFAHADNQEWQVPSLQVVSRGEPLCNRS